MNKNIDFIIKYLKNEYKDFIIKLNYWSSIKLSEKNVFQINHTNLNEKHKLLTRNYNSFCKANYIDYNCLVDQIMQMSQAYMNNDKSSDETQNKLKSELDLENLIRTKNLKNVSIFKTNTIANNNINPNNNQNNQNRCTLNYNHKIKNNNNNNNSLLDNPTHSLHHIRSKGIIMKYF